MTAVLWVAAALAACTLLALLLASRRVSVGRSQRDHSGAAIAVTTPVRRIP